MTWEDHLNRLRRAGLITAQSRDGQCLYRLSDPAVVQSIELLRELSRRTKSHPLSHAPGSFDATPLGADGLRR